MKQLLLGFIVAFMVISQTHIASFAEDDINDVSDENTIDVLSESNDENETESVTSDEDLEIIGEESIEDFEVSDENNISVETDDIVGEVIEEKVNDIQENYMLGVNVIADDSTHGYKAVFVYQDSKAEKVEVTGGFTFFKQADAPKYKENGGSADGIQAYSPYEWQPGMFSTTYDPGGAGSYSFEMNKVEGSDYWLLELPLPAGQYTYAYVVDDNTILDPHNLPLNNNGTDGGWSHFYIGDASTATDQQKYIYARTDGKTGSVSFTDYIAVDGTKQPLGIYLPYGYDATRSEPYKTIYVSHGGGGNEVEWLSLGSVDNIMDNLIAEGLSESAIVVTMNKSYFIWDYDNMTTNVLAHILPYIEENYNVSTEVKNRAFCGLSMGGMTTSYIYQTNADQFGYFGVFSGANNLVDMSAYDNLHLPTLMIGAGNLDMALIDSDGLDSGKTIAGFLGKLNSRNIEYSYYEVDGAHDWFAWRALFTIFVKDIIWRTDDVDGLEIDKPIDSTDSKDEEDTKNNVEDTKEKDINKVVNTGDETNYLMYSLMLGCMFILSSVLIYRKKKYKSEI